MAPSVLLASASARHVLTITTPAHGTRKILSVQFAADGSIFVHLPYFQSSEGYLALANYEPSAATPNFTSFETPHKTNERVKFSYHPNGRVHFSQDSKIETRVKSEIDPIEHHRGPLFNLSAVGLHGFDPASSKDRKPASRSRSVTDCHFTENVRGVSITGFVVGASDRKFDVDCAILASSRELDYAVAVSSSVHEPPANYDGTHMLFLGGFVGAGGLGGITSTRQALLAIYPPGAARHAFDWLPSVDHTRSLTPARQRDGADPKPFASAHTKVVDAGGE